MWNQPTFVNCKAVILVDPRGSRCCPRRAYSISRRHIDSVQQMPDIQGSTWVYLVNTARASFRPFKEG